MEVKESIEIAADPGDVWAIAGDVGSIADWVPALESCEMHGDIRRSVLAGGGDVSERIVEHSDAGRYYVYEYVDGALPLKVYRARLSVHPVERHSRVAWESEFEAGNEAADKELAVAIAGIYRGALEELKNRAEP